MFFQRSSCRWWNYVKAWCLRPQWVGPPYLRPTCILILLSSSFTASKVQCSVFRLRHMGRLSLRSLEAYWPLDLWSVSQWLNKTDQRLQFCLPVDNIRDKRSLKTFPQLSSQTQLFLLQSDLHKFLLFLLEEQLAFVGCTSLNNGSLWCTTQCELNWWLPAFR